MDSALKRAPLFLVALSISLTAVAGLPPTRLQTADDTGLSTTFNLTFPNVHATRTGTNVTLGNFTAGSAASPSVSLNGDGGMYSTGLGAPGFSANGAYAGLIDSSQRWLLGRRSGGTANTPVTIECDNGGTNFDCFSIHGASRDANSKWTFNVDNVNDQFIILNGSIGETGIVMPTSGFVGVGGSPMSRFGILSASNIATDPKLAGNLRTIISAKNTDTTVNNYSGFQMYNANGLTGYEAWVNEAHGASSSSHWSLGVINAGVVSEGIRLNKDLTLQFFGYSTGVPYFSATGVITSQALTNGQVLVGSTGSTPVAAALTAGAGIAITNGAGSISIAASGTAAPNAATKTTNYTLVATDDEIIMNCAAACTLTVPDCTTLGSNKTWHVNDISYVALTVARTGTNIFQIGALTDTSMSSSEPVEFDLHCNQGGTLYAY